MRLEQVLLSALLSAVPGCARRAPELTPETTPSAALVTDPALADSPAPDRTATGFEPTGVVSTGPVLALVVGRELRDLFVPLDRDAYAPDEVGPTLEALRSGSGALCRFKHGLAERDDDAVEAFVSPAARFVHSKLGAKWSVIAGCWNFIRLNDRRPHRDFDVVRKLVPAPDGYDCYAVGVLQPYIMSEVLGCRTMTMVDFDWQVHAVHWQLLAAWGAGGLAAASLERTIADLRVDWIAYHEPKERHAVDMHTLCHPGFAERCRTTLDAFDRRRDDPTLERITLNLAGLHEIALAPQAEGGRVPVVYLSNATEKHFLTRDEFDHMISRIEAGLRSGQRAVLVHHVANESTFGIYELVRTEEGSRLEVLCRDEYRKGKEGGQVYETWFETRARTSKKVRACKMVPV